MGAVGSAYDNSMMESFWARMQVELLNRRKWKTRIELASAINDYIELWHNTRRCHSALGMLTPTEIEDRWLKSQDEPLPRLPWSPRKAAKSASCPRRSWHPRARSLS
jgi:transposase InsO family protein